jgi:hypothetical protein
MNFTARERMVEQQLVAGVSSTPECSQRWQGRAPSFRRRSAADAHTTTSPYPSGSVRPFRSPTWWLDDPGSRLEAGSGARDRDGVRIPDRGASRVGGHGLRSNAWRPHRAILDASTIRTLCHTSGMAASAGRKRRRSTLFGAAGTPRVPGPPRSSEGTPGFSGWREGANPRRIQGRGLA